MSSEGTIKHHSRILHYCFLAFVVLATRTIGYVVLPMYDDAFITLRYASNLADGNGFVFNQGERILGVTGPAYAIILAAFFFLHLPMPTSVPIFNILCDVFLVVSTAALIEKHENRIASVLFALLFALSPIMTRIAIGGMEMNLFLLASVYSIYLYHKGQKKQAAILSSLAFFLRPEAIILSIVFVSLEWNSHGIRSVLPLAVIGLFGMAIPSFAMYLYYGTIIPQSIVAKSHSLNQSVFLVAKNLVVPEVLSWLVIPFSVLGMVQVLKKKSVFTIFAIWFAVYGLAYFLARPHVWSWYAGPIQYTLYLLASLTIGNFVVRTLPRLGQSNLVAPLCGAAVVAIWSVVLIRMGPSLVTKNVYESIKEWVRANVKENSSILAADIGVIGFYSKAKIYDAAGLVWPRALCYKNVAEMALAVSPDYVFLNATSENVEVFGKPTIGSMYRPTIRFSREALTDLSLTPMNFQTEWSQDYIMFQRNIR